MISICQNPPICVEYQFFKQSKTNMNSEFFFS